MKIIKVTPENVIEKYPVILHEEFPNTSFPLEIDQNCLPDGYYIVKETPPPSHGFNEGYEEIEPVYTDLYLQFVQTWRVFELSEEEKNIKLQNKKNELSEKVTDYRWKKERSGVTVNGVPISTDDISQTKLLSVFMLAKFDPNFTIRWKANNGTFLTLNAAQIMAISTAVRNHIQGCFEEEELLKQNIQNSTTIEELNQIEEIIK